MSTCKTDSLFPNARIASPCSARWEEMAGDERLRFCQHCQKHVYNFTAMTTAEAVALIQSKEGRLCGRFYQLPDGTLMASDCPAGLARVRQQARRAALAVMTLVAFLFTTVGWAKHAQQKKAVMQKGEVSERVEEAVYMIKLKLGLMPAPVVLGKVAIPISRPTTCNTNSSPVTGAQN